MIPSQGIDRGPIPLTRSKQFWTYSYMASTTAKTVSEYNELMSGKEWEICSTLYKLISVNLVGAENKIWHGSPVWFIDGNPIVSYSKQKAGIKLMFFSGADFDEPEFKMGSGKFKDASVTYTDAAQVNHNDIKRWLTLARDIQWDYKNIVKRRGELVKLWASIQTLMNTSQTIRVILR